MAMDTATMGTGCAGKAMPRHCQGVSCLPTACTYNVQLIRGVNDSIQVSGMDGTSNGTRPGNRSRLIVKDTVESSIYNIEHEKLIGDSTVSLVSSSYSYNTTKSDFSTSILDPDHLEMTKSQFRGLIYMLWLSMIGGLLSTFCRNYRLYGFLIGSRLYNIACIDIDMYILAEVVLILSTLLALIMQKVFIKGFLPISLSIYVRHTLQASIIFAPALFAYHRQWPFIQSSVLTLHAIAMYMKIHSYFSVNEVLHRAWKLQEQEQDQEYQQLLQALKADKCIYYEGSLKYPDNVTLGNFLYYLVIPSLVYQVNPPRSNGIRWNVIVEKTFSAIIGLLLIYVIFEHWILSVLFELETMNIWEAILELLFPFTMTYILLFYFVFEVLCTWFSEISSYGIRSFYEDWWNSTTFDQFARKWNRPVHLFLYHHIYEEIILVYKLRKSYASAFTFFFSSCLHEFALSVISRRIRLYFFFIQMLQVPLIYLGRMSFSKRHPLLSNLLFLASIMIGPPLLCLLYCREYFITENWRTEFDAHYSM